MRGPYNGPAILDPHGVRAMTPHVEAINDARRATPAHRLANDNQRYIVTMLRNGFGIVADQHATSIGI